MAKKSIASVLPKLVLKEDRQISRILKDLAPEDADAIKAALKVLQAMGDQVDPETIQDLMALVGAPAAAAGGEPAATPEQKEMAAGYPAMKERAEAAEATVKTLKAKAEADADVEFPVTKEGNLDLEKIPENLRPALKALWKDKTRLAAVEKTLADERETRVTKEYVEVAADLKFLPIKKELLGKVLKTVATLEPGAYKEVHEALVAANAAVEKSDPTKELGSNHSRGSAGGSDDPEAQYEAEINAPAKVIAKEMHMSQDEAVTRFITKTDDGRRAYARHTELVRKAAKRA